MTESDFTINDGEGNRDTVFERVCYLIQTVIDSVFSIVKRNGKTFFSVSYDYVFSELLAFTLNGCFNLLIRLIHIQTVTMT